MSRNRGPFQMLTLMELPLDNLIQILKFAEPADIFSFSTVRPPIFAAQLCATLGADLQKVPGVTLTRTVWMNTVRRVCDLNSVFKPSFPLDDISLSELLEHAAASAKRFSTLLYKQKGEDIPEPSPAVSSRPGWRRHPTSLRKTQVPGSCARFIIVTNTLLHLWDLGCGAGKLIKSHALTSIALPLSVGKPYISILPTPTGAGIEVIFISHNVGAGSSTIAIFHIFPSDVHPEFIYVTDPLAFPGFMQGLLVKPDHLSLEHYSQLVFVHEDTVVAVGATTVTVWDMPTPNSEIVMESICSHLPMLTLTHPFLAPDAQLEISTSADWLPTNEPIIVIMEPPLGLGFRPLLGQHWFTVLWDSADTQYPLNLLMVDAGLKPAAVSERRPAHWLGRIKWHIHTAI
ncbi:hypothetical protein DFH09DRAFT_1099630 [Mycena vulgaris]|nr:hypothetical protein DFH09DRAFT_1099630 [Mycena vulgaris]